MKPPDQAIDRCEIPRRMSDNKPISLQQVAEVVAYVESLDFEAKLKRVDRIFADQPAVLGAVVQLHSLGVDYPVQEHAMHVLLILYECFTRYVSDLPRISKEMVQAAFDNNVAELRFYDGETTEEAARLQRLAALEYPERNVLAFVVGGASGEKGASFAGGFERRGFPEVQGIDRLDIVVAVDKVARA